MLVAMSFAGCGGQCAVAIEPVQFVRDLQLAPFQVSIPTDWKQTYSGDNENESLAVSDPDFHLALHIHVCPA